MTSDFHKTIIDKIFTIIPSILYASDLSTHKLLILGLPIFILLFHQIFSYIKNFNYNTYTFSIYEVKRMGWGTYKNDDYKLMIKFINKKVYTGEKTMMNNCESHETNSIKNNLLLIKINHTIEYTINNNKLYIQRLSFKDKQDDEKKADFYHYFSIWTYDKNTLELFKKEFIDFCKIEEDELKNKKDIYYIYEDDCFNQYKVTINKNYDNTFLKKEINKLVKKSTKSFVSEHDKYKRCGVPYKKGFLLYGIPRTGKSSLSYAIANEMGMRIYMMPHKTDNFEEFKKNIKKIENSVVVFEEIDCIKGFKKRDGKIDSCDLSGIDMLLDTLGVDDSDNSDNNKSNGKQKKKGLTCTDYDLTKFYLEILDGYNYFHNCIIIMTTNHLEEIDPAIYRPGRIDHLIEFAHADQYQIKEIFKTFYEYDISDKDAEDIEQTNITTSFIINTAIMPNKDNYQKAIKLCLEKKS